jgi:hypothetical protein
MAWFPCKKHLGLIMTHGFGGDCNHSSIKLAIDYDVIIAQLAEQVAIV